MVIKRLWALTRTLFYYDLRIWIIHKTTHKTDEQSFINYQASAPVLEELSFIPFQPFNGSQIMNFMD